MLMTIGVAAKGLLVLAAALGTVALLRRRSAATRYLVWSMAMICLLLLPLLGGLVPVWHAPLLPELPSHWAQPERAEPTPRSLPPVGSAASPTPLAAIIERSMPFTGIMASPTPRAPMVVPAREPSEATPSSEPSGAVPSTVAPGSASQRSLAPASGAEEPALSFLQRSTLLAWVAVPTWPALLAGLYFLGAALMLVHLAAGAARVARMMREARPVVEGPLRREFEQALAKLEIERPVRLLESGAATVPVAWELFRPAVLLPRGAEAWPRERRQVVLLHELAHVQRRDCQMQLLAHVALALHWLNPLAWLAMRRLRIEREHACDDKVLSFGCRASDYADHLLQIARRLVSPGEPGWASVAMARTSRLEGRVAAILDPENPRRLPERRTTMTVFVTTLVLLLPLAALQPSAPAQQDAGHPVTPHLSTQHAVTEHAMAVAQHVSDALHVMTEQLFTHETMSHEPSPEGSAHTLATGAAGHGSSASQDGVEPTIHDLVQMRIHGVSTDFIREVREAFGRPVTVRELVQMRIHGTSTEFVREMQDVFGDDLTISNLTQMKIHGTSAEFVREMHNVFGDDLTISNLTQMRIHGTSTEFVRQMRDVFGDDLTIRDLTQMRIHGASTEFVRAMRELLPDEDITVRDITQMRIHGVSADLVRELQEDGYDNLTVNDLVQMKIHGFDRWLRRRGGR